MIFINKRGVFKNGRTFSEMINKDKKNPSDFSWISRYGSVSFNNFGKDFPDGGINEVGLYIWEMNEEANFPKNKKLPKLMHMNWIQYVLDNCLTLDDAIQSASSFQLDDGGMTWHYFISDATGNCAALAFIEGKVKVNRGENMPVPGLFNTPYDREMELLRYYKGFGGLYDIELNNPDVPRFVKTAALLRDYQPAMSAVEYGLGMLKNISVYDEPEWSVIIDASRRDVYFKTRLNPEVKHFSMGNIDFSNSNPVQILDMDIKEKGDVINRFKPYSNEVFKSFMESKLIPLLPKEFFGVGGLTKEEFVDRFTTHGDKAVIPENQYFAGVWKTKPAVTENDLEFELKVITNKDAVSGEIVFIKGEPGYPIDHINLIGNKLTFTYKNKRGYLREVVSTINNEKLSLHIKTTEGDAGQHILYRQK
jgi:choloylglycine hydrolase